MDNNCQPIGSIETYDLKQGGNNLDFPISGNNWTFVGVALGAPLKANRGIRLSNASLKSNL
jgi:hypothetical protein